MAFKIRVDQTKCNGCEECLDVCTADVFEMQQGQAIPVKSDDCQGCESCMAACKENAITVDDTRAELSEQCRTLLRDIL